MKAQGLLAGNFYWYSNNWHYIRKWDHLKNAETLNRLNDAQRHALLSLQTQDFSISDGIMGRCISTAISLLWTEAQIAEKGRKMVEIIEQVLEGSAVEV